MTAINVTVIGNLARDPELRYTPTGAAVASFTVASNKRYRDNAGEWRDGPTSWVRCNAWRDLAEHIVESLAKGDRVIVTGEIGQRDYEVKNGKGGTEKRSTWEVQAVDVAASLRSATVKVAKTRRSDVPLPEDPWADVPAHDASESAGEPPF
jgi:single-strand DNA-binding protein